MYAVGGSEPLSQRWHAALCLCHFKMLHVAFVAPLLASLSPHTRSPDAHTIRSAGAATGKRAVVTPLLPHDPGKAREATKVELPGYNATELHSGFFEIDGPTNSHTYFMLSSPLSGRKDAPVLLWLNGGPGASSLLGFYDELGPFGINEDLEIEPRAVSWTLDAYVLALDNPLGVGYSHTSSKARMATNQTTVGEDLYEALRQFFLMFPELRTNPFYATGESYAGKYVPACAYTIHIKNQALPVEQRINLRGIAVGDGAFDPPTQFTGFGPLLFNLGLADTRAAKVYDSYDKRLTAALAAGDDMGAFRSFDEMLNGDYYGTEVRGSGRHGQRGRLPFVCAANAPRLIAGVVLRWRHRSGVTYLDRRHSLQQCERSSWRSWRALFASRQ